MQYRLGQHSKLRAVPSETLGLQHYCGWRKERRGKRIRCLYQYILDPFIPLARNCPNLIAREIETMRSTWTISILVSGVPGARSVRGACYLQFQPSAAPAPSVPLASCSNEAQELNHSEDKPPQRRGRGSRRIRQVGALPGKLAVGEAHEGGGGEEAGA